MGAWVEKFHGERFANLIYAQHSRDCARGNSVHDAHPTDLISPTLRWRIPILLDSQLGKCPFYADGATTKIDTPDIGRYATHQGSVFGGFIRSSKPHATQRCG